MRLPPLQHGASVALSAFLGAALPYALGHLSGVAADWRAVAGGALLTGLAALVHLYLPAPKAAEEIVK